MLDKVRDIIKEYDLIHREDRIIVAVSGGADSICLLHILYMLKEELDLQIYAAHLNHNFRGIEAQMDAQYVANFCEELDIICFVKSVDAPKYAKEYGLSDEEAGRALRYEFFEEIMGQVGANKVAVAHNQNDQAETVLMRLMRGTGIQGLTAIHHERGYIIRPLLDITRREIEDYCLVNKLSPRLDKTNLEPIYHRNKIRLELIPYIEKEYNPNIIENLARTAEILKKDSDFIEEYSREKYRELRMEGDGDYIAFNIKAIKKIQPALQARIFRLAAEELVGKREVLEYKHVQATTELMERGETGKKILLPMGIMARISYGRLIFTTREDEGEERTFYYELPPNDSFYIKDIDATIDMKVYDREEIKSISRNKFIKSFDYDRIKDGLNVRNRREGDRFWPLGLVGTKKLKDFFIDYKIDREKRDKIPLICNGDEIIWVIGYRISERYKIRDETKKVLVVEYKKGFNGK